ncbi:MAG: Protein hipA [uncultured Sulfurovum sp.]|uniref:Protein hipA n=1 Tax=uncultured Sulfurovum sp. TaxID=269237 RepID=A0A6S6U9Z9_9BACT|nr:MAG: Protein hipA [uncultured Sulfurovum sp.]
MKKRVKLEEIKRLFEAQEQLTTKELGEKTGLTDRTLRNYLALLIEEGLIVAVGQTNRRYYQRNYAVDEKPIVVAVLQNGAHIGTLSFTYAQGYVFSYLSNYKGERLPSLHESVSSSYALFTLFENLIPESTRRERLLLKDGVVLNPLELLVELDNTHGSLDFVPLTSLVKTDTRDDSKIPNWKSIKNVILEKNSFVTLLDYEMDIPQEVLQGASLSRELYSSLSGYQHKIDVNLNQKSKRVYRVKKESGELAHYLLKPYAADSRIKNTPYLAFNEHLFMTFAKNELKLNVPFSAILLGDNRDFYFLTKRYDRYRGYKYKQYDFAQQLDIESEDKYDISIISILEKFNSIVQDKKSKEDVYTFIIYASLIKHGDFHAKNIGLIESGRKSWELAPLYDIISTYVYEGKSSDDFGIGFDYSNPKKRKLKYEDYEKMGITLELPINRAKIILKETIKRFQIYFPKYIETTIAFEKSLGYPHLLSKKLHSLYNEKNIEFDKLGVLGEVGMKRESL